jgi:hypothetical protein
MGHAMGVAGHFDQSPADRTISQLSAELHVSLARLRGVLIDTLDPVVTGTLRC